MANSRICLIAALGFMLGCKSERRPVKLPEVHDVFPVLLLPPEPSVISREGSADALQITLFSPTPTAGVAEYYRRVLRTAPWRILGDSKNADGTIVLYADRNGRPLWVRIWSTTDKAGTMVQLAGAVVPQDSLKATPSGSGKPAKGGT